jgi:hypothetical protein
VSRIARRAILRLLLVASEHNGTHRFLSVDCFHDRHGFCEESCCYCAEPCVCYCHDPDRFVARESDDRRW